MLKRLVLSVLVALVLLVPVVAVAQDTTHAAPAATAAAAKTTTPAPVLPGSGWGHFSAALAIGLAAFGGALSQGKTAVAACEGIARNPGAGASIRAMAFLALVLIESLVIYALVIAFVINGK